MMQQMVRVPLLSSRRGQGWSLSSLAKQQARAKRQARTYSTQLKKEWRLGKKEGKVEF
jgi:hypothetical protein